jgi:hypothetical protein
MPVAKVGNSTWTVAAQFDDGQQQVGIRSRVQCAGGGSLNPRECAFTAPSSAMYYFVWSGDGLSHFTAVGSGTFSSARVGPNVGSTWSGSNGCCDSRPSCSWSNVNAIAYTGTCTSTSYPTSAFGVQMSAGQTVIVVTGSDGLM